MAHLTYYANERVRYNDKFKEKLDENQAKYLFRRLKSHYKFRQNLRFWGWEENGARCSQYMLTLQHTTDIGTIAHEVAHAIQYKERNQGKNIGKKWHTKHHAAIMKRVMRYIEKNKVAWLETCRAKTERIIKSIEKKTKMRAEHENRKTTVDYKLEKTERQIKKWESKSKRAQNALKKLERRKRFLLKRLSISPTGGQSSQDSRLPTSAP